MVGNEVFMRSFAAAGFEMDARATILTGWYLFTVIIRARMN